MIVLPSLLEAKQIKTISSQEGISNNAILCMHQNSMGHLYLGTMDGLNIWDGHTIKTFNAADGKNYFFGNKIRHIVPGNDETLYLLTTYGLAILNTLTREVTFFENMEFSDIMTITDDGNVFSINSHNELQWLNTGTSELKTLHGPAIDEEEECRHMTMVSDGTLCIFTSRNIYLISFDCNTSPNVRKVESLNIPCHFVAPRFNTDHHILITSDGKLCSFDITTRILETKAVLHSPLLITDEITALVPLDNTCMIGFRESGVKILEYDSSTLTDTPIDYRILSMESDKRQPIIWIGTDCNGLIRWSDSATDISCVTFDDLPYSIMTPVRCIFLDRNSDLWFGTKGDGLFRIRDFSTESIFDRSNTDRFDTNNSAIVQNNIYSIERGSGDYFWIGGDGRGLNYYSYSTGHIGVVRGSETISHVHSILESEDSTLWVSTDVHGCWKCRFRTEGQVPVIYEATRLEFTEPFNHKTSVYSIAQQNDSILWFGSRRNGVLSYNIRTGKSLVVQFPTDDGLAANETFYVTKSEDMLFATGNGVAAYSAEKDTTFLLDYIPKKATHAILSDSSGNIWVTTNSGIISLDKNLNYRASFNRFSGMDVIEYSDGACCYDAGTNTMFFGGINGFTVIRENPETVHDKTAFIPEINITNFIQNDDVSHVSTKIKNGKVRVPYSQSVFGIEFSVVDNLNYPDYRFIYRIDGYNDVWTANPNNIIYLPFLSPGNYNLRIKYVNQATEYESEEESLPIYIVPPLHRRWWAIVIYILSGIFVVYKLIKQSRDKYASMQEKLRKQYKKEILKVKNETINTVAEELSTQTTFMLGLCQQIRTQTSGKQDVSSKVNLLEYNIAKINRILYILNEYKGLSENSSGEVSLVHVSHTANELLEIMKPGANLRNVTVFHTIESGIIVPINKEAFYTLFNTLIHKMISICSGTKDVHIAVRRKETGDGICLSIIATLEESLYQETVSAMIENPILNTSDNDEDTKNLEFTLCNKLINEMGGNMTYSYDKSSQIFNLHIELPQHKPEGNAMEHVISSFTEDINTLVESQMPGKTGKRQHQKNIYVVSANRETSSFVGYFLSDTYNIFDFADNRSALTDIRTNMPAAIIYDVTSMNGHFTEFIGKIRQHKITGQIPVITLTSSLQITEREECIKQGADLCISFPFNMDYLRSALERILNKRESIAEYYSSPISAYIMKEGKIIHRDEQNFINKILKFVEDNLSNPELNAAMIAQNMGISERGIYRRFEDLTKKTLHQMIRESRIEQAANLLACSKLSIDEIMFKVGYENRSTFHRNFKEAKGMAPKDYRKSVKSKVIETFSSSEPIS